MSEQGLRLLIVDDEESVRTPLAEHLNNIYHYKVDAAADGQQALNLLDKFRGQYDVALIDQVLEGMINGLDLLSRIKEQYPDIQVIIFTGWEMNEDEGVEILRQGAYRYIAKPYNLRELALTIRFAAEERWTRLERHYLAALVKANQGLTQKKQQQEQLSIAWDFVREQLDVSTFFVGLCSLNSEHLSFPIAYDDGKVVTLPEINLEGELAELSLASYVVKNSEEVLWSTPEEMEMICKEKHITPRLEGRPSASCFCLPLQLGGLVIGVLSAQSYQQYIFTPVLQNALRALSGHLSAALENSRLFSDLEQKRLDIERQANRLSALHGLAITINSTLELKEILTKTCESAVEFFGADHSGLVLFDPDFERGKVVAEYPDFGALEWPIRLRGIPAEEKLIETLQPLIFYDTQTDESLGEIRNYLSKLGIRSILFVPVIGRTGIIGSFSLDVTKREHHFSTEDVELSKAFAAQVAVAIENARLFYAAKEGRDYLQSLFEASSEVISPRDPNDVLQSIVEQACQSTSAWRAVILLVDESGYPRILASSGFDQHMEAATSIRASGISRQVMSSGVPRFIDDISEQSDVVHPAMLEQGVKGAACLPLQLMGKNIGILWIHFQEEHVFSESEKTALQIYANQSAVAYDNARHMRELSQLHQATEAISSVEEPKQVLQKIVEGATHVLGADFALIWSYDVNRDTFIPEEMTAFGLTEEQLRKFREEEPSAGKTTRRVLKDRYIEVNDLAMEPLEHLGEPTRTFLQELMVSSFQSILLSVADEPLGVLHLDYKTPRHFDREERRILENFANHAALTLKKARLISQVKRSREAAQVVAKVSTLGELENTLEEIVHGARDVLKCDITTLYTFDERAQKFNLVAGTGYENKGNLRPPEDVARDSSLWRVIELTSPYYHYAENAPEDRLLQGGFVRNEQVRSSLAVQLRSGNERVGVMFINYCTPHRFTDDEIKNALQFADQAAVAIWNAQLHGELQKRVQTLNALYEAGKAISSTLTLDETLNRIVAQALNVVGSSCQSDGCFSYIALRNGDVLQFVAASSNDIYRVLQQQAEINLEHNEKIGIVGQVIRKGVSANISDVTKHIDYIRVSGDTRSQLSVPIKRGEVITGALSIEHPDFNAFLDDDVQNLELLASQAGVAIENARLFEAVEKLTSSLDQEDTYTAICRIAVDYFKVDHSGLVLFDEDLKTGNVVAEYPKVGMEGVEITLRGVPAEEKLIESRKPLIVQDVPGEAGFEPVRGVLNRLGTRSILLIPIIGKNRILGSFGLDVMKQPRNFTKDEIEVCKIFAAQAAVAIENAQKYKDAKKSLGATTALAWMGVVSSTWRHSIAGHAITVRDQLELLRSDLIESKASDSLLKRLASIERLTNLIIEKPVSSPLGSDEGIQSIGLNRLIVERTKQLWDSELYQPVKLDLQLDLKDNATIRIDPKWFRQVLDIVLDNAVEATSKQVERRIILHTKEIDRRAIIEITDNGGGVPKELLSKLFMEPILKTKGSKGLGMGLLLARMILQAYGGELQLGETGSNGTTMIASMSLET
ncbi:MAG: GAF domain-containing protein [Chloroflexi bacterium]|nr:GAF domain-containing protein [Chloroflexota bacterium]